MFRSGKPNRSVSSYFRPDQFPMFFVCQLPAVMVMQHLRLNVLSHPAHVVATVFFVEDNLIDSVTLDSSVHILAVVQMLDNMTIEINISVRVLLCADNFQFPVFGMMRYCVFPLCRRIFNP